MRPVDDLHPVHVPGKQFDVVDIVPLPERMGVNDKRPVLMHQEKSLPGIHPVYILMPDQPFPVQIVDQEIRPPDSVLEAEKYIQPDLLPFFSGMLIPQAEALDPLPPGQTQGHRRISVEKMIRHKDPRISQFLIGPGHLRPRRAGAGTPLTGMQMCLVSKSHLS